MNKRSAQIDGLDDDPREIARIAARRAGKSLDEWLVEAICEKAERALRGGDPDEDEDDRLEAIARRLERDKERSRYSPEGELRAKGDANGRRSRFDDSQARRQRQADFDAEDSSQSPAAIAASQRQTARALQEIVALLEANLHRFDLQATEEAIEQRILESEQKITKALAAFAELLEDGRGSRPTPPEGLGAEILEQLGRLKRRLA